ncbi:hypothetical protein Dsin_022370 [Dipteronia sinensis]|uniref:Pentatricopeptide repeat-containing protein n=1 Tax=Dipteronia sinensis TaxID=43782 RepID=A0AAE0DZQ0_9ROSI|nr:hypothetical protein Dsin_022370 [Dipteronia sinensis]
MKMENVKPNHEALSVVVWAYADSGQVDQALDMYYYVIGLCDCGPDVFAFNSLLALLVDCKKIETARKLYDEMCKREYGANNYSTCIIAKGLCKEGKVEEAIKLIEERFEERCVPNIVFCNTLIDGYCKRGDVESANKLFRELKRKGFVPTLETYGVMVNGFCKEGSFKAIDRPCSHSTFKISLPNTQLILPTADPKAIPPTADPKAIPLTAQQCQTEP